MRVTKWAESAILCCMHLGRQYDLPAVGASEISESQGIDLQYLHQVLQRLRKGDIVTSVRGARGGYRLSRPPSDINLKEILQAVEGATFELFCDSAPSYPNEDALSLCNPLVACSLKGVWHELREAIDRVLSQRTIAGLLEAEAQPALVTLTRSTQRFENADPTAV